MSRQTKYRAVRTTIDGVTFASKKEAGRYTELKMLLKTGQITDLKLQPKIVLSIGGVHICDYRADFFYIERVPGGVRAIHEDCKGYKTPIYQLKKKLVLALTGIEIRET